MGGSEISYKTAATKYQSRASIKVSTVVSRHSVIAQAKKRRGEVLYHTRALCSNVRVVFVWACRVR